MIEDVKDELSKSDWTVKLDTGNNAFILASEVYQGHLIFLTLNAAEYVILQDEELKYIDRPPAGYDALRKRFERRIEFRTSGDKFIIGRSDTDYKSGSEVNASGMAGLILSLQEMR